MIELNDHTYAKLCRLDPLLIHSALEQSALLVGGPLVGKLMDYYPRVPTYISLNIIQVIYKIVYMTAFPKHIFPSS